MFDLLAKLNLKFRAYDSYFETVIHSGNNTSLPIEGVLSANPLRYSFYASMGSTLGPVDTALFPVISGSVGPRFQFQDGLLIKYDDYPKIVTTSWNIDGMPGSETWSIIEILVREGG